MKTQLNKVKTLEDAIIDLYINLKIQQNVNQKKKFTFRLIHLMKIN